MMIITSSNGDIRVSSRLPSTRKHAQRSIYANTARMTVSIVPPEQTRSREDQRPHGHGDRVVRHGYGNAAVMATIAISLQVGGDEALFARLDAGELHGERPPRLGSDPHVREAREVRGIGAAADVVGAGG